MAVVPATALTAAKAPDVMTISVAEGLSLRNALVTLVLLMPDMKRMCGLLRQGVSVSAVTVGFRLDLLTLTPMILATVLFRLWNVFACIVCVNLFTWVWAVSMLGTMLCLLISIGLFVWCSVSRRMV